ENDELLEVKITSGDDEILLGTNLGYANRFHETLVREVGRNSIGVKGINLRESDYVIGMIVSNDEEESLLVMSENGYGKRSEVGAFRKTKRGSKGVKALNVTDKTGKMIYLAKASDDNDLMIITINGTVIRQSVSNIRIMGRNTQGVRLIKLREKDQIADVCILPEYTEEPEAEVIEGVEVQEEGSETKVEDIQESNEGTSE
ncbi:MAG: DNA gyrase subunit A, partial [Candidatus Delongbacteria bacterium]|nr:DNA gyrase subunit A [Candidatus Delongbacteria bacterium]